MVNSVTASSALENSQKTANSSAQLADDFDDFLLLLTTQLQNQDPLSPMDSNEFTSQLVQFAGVEQQINSNQKLNDLVSLSLGSSFSSALNYVGMDISYLGSEAYYDGSTPVKINYSVDGEPVSTTINIYDEDNKLVYTHEVSADENVEEFIWQGQNKGGGEVDSGTYKISVDALDADGEALDTTTVVSGRVKGVETQNGSTYLLVGERAVSIANIINVIQAPVDTEETETS